MADRAEHQRRVRRTRDRALVLLLLGLVLLLPPVAQIFHLDSKIAGIPVTLLYLFTVWAVLIVGTAWLAPRLSETDDPQDPRS